MILASISVIVSFYVGHLSQTSKYLPPWLIWHIPLYRYSRRISAVWLRRWRIRKFTVLKTSSMFTQYADSRRPWCQGSCWISATQKKEKRHPPAMCSRASSLRSLHRGLQTMGRTPKIPMNLTMRGMIIMATSFPFTVSRSRSCAFLISIVTRDVLAKSWRRWALMFDISFRVCVICLGRL